MAGLREQLLSFITELETFQSDQNTIKDQTDAKLLKDIIEKLHVAIEGKQNDWQITHLALANVKLACTPFQNNVLTTRIMEGLSPLCENELERRKKCVEQILHYIYLFKITSQPAYINHAQFDTEIFTVLEHIFNHKELHQLLKETSLTLLMRAIKESKIFSDSDLNNWITKNIKPTEQVFKEMIEAESLVPRPRHDPVRELDPLIQERFRRKMHYMMQRPHYSAPNSPTEKSTPPTRIGGSLPSSPTHSPMSSPTSAASPSPMAAPTAILASSSSTSSSQGDSLSTTHEELKRLHPHVPVLPLLRLSQASSPRARSKPGSGSSPSRLSCGSNDDELPDIEHLTLDNSHGTNKTGKPSTK